MSVENTLLSLAVELVQHLRDGNADKAKQKAKAISQGLALKAATRAAAKGSKKALGK